MLAGYRSLTGHICEKFHFQNSWLQSCNINFSSYNASTLTYLDTSESARLSLGMDNDLDLDFFFSTEGDLDIFFSRDLDLFFSRDLDLDFLLLSLLLFLKYTYIT